MKLKSPIYTLLVFLASFILFTSCQSDLDVTSGVDERDTAPGSTESFQKNDVLVNEILRITTNNGAKDDVLDGTSKLQVVLPVNLTLNNQSLRIETEEDLYIAEAVSGYASDDDDKVHFEYPIKVRLDNYSERDIENEAAFNALKQELQGQMIHDCIDCTQIVFPFSINFFNTVSREKGVLLVDSNETMVRMLENLLDSDILEIAYPINIRTSYEADAIRVLNNNQFRNEIIDSGNLCEMQPDVQPTGKITVCHNIANNPRAIEIDFSSLQAHLRHGDLIGDCSGN